MVGPFALTDLASVKRLLKMRPSQDEDNLLLEDLIDVATGKIERFTRRRLKSRDYEDDPSAVEDDGSDSCLIRLIEWPVSEVALVQIRGVSLTADQYVASLDQGMIRLKSGWVGAEPGVVRVDYTAGYEPVPPELKFAASALVVELFLRNSPSDRRLGLASRTTGDKGETYQPEADIPVRIQQSLAPFCRNAISAPALGVS